MATNTIQEQQALQAKIDLAYVEVKKVFDEKKEINRQLKGLDLTEAERNALQARRLQLDDQGDLLFRDISSTESQLNRLTQSVPTGSNPPISTLNNQPVPASSNQNTGGSGSTTTAGRYQQAVANDQVRLNNINQQLITTDQKLTDARSREAELTQTIRNSPEGSAQYQAALAERTAVRRQALDLENQQISLRQDAAVRQNSLATNTNQLKSLTTETSVPTVPAPAPTMVTDTTGTIVPVSASLAGTASRGIVTAPQDDPEAGEAEARAFLAQQNSRVANPEPDPGFTYYGAPAVAPPGPPRTAAPVNPNPWAGVDADKAAAWARLSPADQRWLGNGDPTDEFILRRAPNGGTPIAAIDAVRDTAPAPLPDDNLAFDPLPDDNLAYTQGVNPGPGYTTTYDEFGNEIPVQPALPDDNLAYTQGVDNTSGYSFEDTGGVPTQTLADFTVQDTSGYSFEDTGGVPTQRLSDFTVQDTAGYSFEDTGGVPTQTLSDFTADPGPEYPVSDDNLGFEQLPDDNLAYTQGANPGPGYGFVYDDNGELIPADSIQAQEFATDNTNPGPGYGISDDNLGFEQLPDDDLAFRDTEVDDTEGYIVPDGTINVPEGQQEFAPTALGGNFSAQYDVESGTYGVFDEDTGQFVQTGLTEQEATLLAQDASVGDPNFAGNADAFGGDTGVPDVPASEIAFEPTALGGDFVAAFDPETQTWGVFDNDTGVFVETGLTEQEATLKAQEYSVGDPNFAGNADAFDSDPGLTPEQQELQATQEAERQRQAAAEAAAKAELARRQKIVEDQRRQANQGDWRVKLRLAGGADYLYRSPDNQKTTGILYPLSVTDGVVFPYTPQITTNYGANYTSYDLTHSNFRGYFYQNSFVDEVTIQAVFTAQDTTEANYMLAVIHFFRSITKMFYGQDPNRGQPPPLVFLQGLGEFQFNLHPCLVRSFTYNMPNDIDYIRARSPNNSGTNLLKRRDLATENIGSYNASQNRLTSAGILPGATNFEAQVPTLGTDSPTYVPTRMETTITLLPIQTRQQVSREFSLGKYSSGELLKQGFW